MIYGNYINSDKYDVTDKCECFQLIQYLLTITDNKFREDFEVNNIYDIYLLVAYFKVPCVNNLS